MSWTSVHFSQISVDETKRGSRFDRNWS